MISLSCIQVIQLLAEKKKENVLSQIESQSHKFPSSHLHTHLYISNLQNHPVMCDILWLSSSYMSYSTSILNSRALLMKSVVVKKLTAQRLFQILPVAPQPQYCETARYTASPGSACASSGHSGRTLHKRRAQRHRQWVVRQGT